MLEKEEGIGLDWRDCFVLCACAWRWGSSFIWKKKYIKWDTRYITENLEKSGASDSILGSGVNKIHDPGTMHVAKKWDRDQK